MYEGYSMYLVRLMRRLVALQAVVLFCVTAAPRVLAQATPQGTTPQSLVGDWEYVVNGNLKLVLHLSVDANGVFRGIIDAPGSPPTSAELRDIKLSGTTLTYNMPSLGVVYEFVQPDGKHMIGPQIWSRVNHAPVSPRGAAGDWEAALGGPYSEVLRLRLDPSGSLTGSLDVLMTTPRRLELRSIQIDGRSITVKTADGNAVQGKFSDDGDAIVGNLQWKRTRTLAEALAHDAAQKPVPTDGTWSGTIRQIPWSDKVKPNFDTLQVIFHFNSAPVSCSVESSSPIEGSREEVPCIVRWDGAKVHVTSLLGVFDGKLSGTRLTGTWEVVTANIGGQPAIVRPMVIELARTTVAPAAN